MRQRCSLPSHKAWADYGGRGIRVCARWERFEAFLLDMGERPGPEYTIERQNNDGDYTPRNCVWALKSEQSKNRRNGRKYTLRGVTLSLKDWSVRVGVPYRTLLARHRAGWPAGRALSEAVAAPTTGIQFRGRTLTVTQWAVELGINSKSLRSRLSKGWDMERIASTPMARTGRHA